MNNKNNKIMTIAYLLGLIESDGSYLMGIAKDGHFSCSIRISSQSNTNILQLATALFQNLDFHVRFQKGKNTTSTERGRAACIVLDGNKKLRKLFEEIEKLNLPFIHAGVKQRDFLIFRYLLFEKTTISQRIALKKSLHKLNQNEPDFEGNQRISREQLERYYGVSVGQSVIDTHRILNTIDSQFAEHQNNILEQIEMNTLQINPDWLAGLLDGDGHFHVEVRKTRTGFYWGTSVQLTMEHRAITTVQVFRYVAGSNKRIGPSALEGKQVNCAVLSVGQPEQLQRIIDCVKEHLLGDLRVQQLKNVEQVIYGKEKNVLNDKEQVISLLKEVYHVSSLSSKGRKRTMTLDEALRWANEKL